MENSIIKIFGSMDFKIAPDFSSRTSSKSAKFRFSKSFYSVKNKRNLSELFGALSKCDGLLSEVWFSMYCPTFREINFFFENVDFQN